MAVFTITTNPDAPFEHSVKPRVRKTAFGDGYGQVVPDGLNHWLTTCTPSWTNLNLAQVTAAEDFLNSLKGSSFQWQSPLHSNQRNWRLNTFTSGALKTSFYLKMEIEEVP